MRELLLRAISDCPRKSAENHHPISSRRFPVDLKFRHAIISPFVFKPSVPTAKRVNAAAKWVVMFLSIMTPVPMNVVCEVEILLRMNDQVLHMSHLKACNKLADISILNEGKNSPCFCEAHQGKQSIRE
jgi:hypothetical protein